MGSSSACVRAAAVPSFGLDGPRDALASASEVVMAGVRQDFRRRYRLGKTDEFSSVFAFRKIIRGKRLELRYRPNTAGTARIGIVVAKKQVRSAVNRNLIRRIVRESFRLLRAGLPHCDIVMRVIARIDSPDRSALHKEIDELFDRLRVSQ
jgi:ribonuclease P protein component